MNKSYYSEDDKFKCLELIEKRINYYSRLMYFALMGIYACIFFIFVIMFNYIFQKEFLGYFFDFIIIIISNILVFIYVVLFFRFRKKYRKLDLFYEYINYYF